MTTTTSEVSLPYIAGLLDSSKGEIAEDGWVYFRHENKLLIDLLEQKVGGSHMKYSDTGNYIWSLKPEDSKEFLKSLVPFLIRNKKAAKTAVQLP